MTEYNNIAGLLEVSNTCLYKKLLKLFLLTKLFDQFLVLV